MTDVAPRIHGELVAGANVIAKRQLSHLHLFSRMRLILFILCCWLAAANLAFAQQDKKNDDLKPADPDTGESTVEETTLGLLPNPFEKQGSNSPLPISGRCWEIPMAA